MFDSFCRVSSVRKFPPHHGKPWEVILDERLQLLDVSNPELGTERVMQQLEPVPPQTPVSLFEEGVLVARVFGLRGHFEVLSYSCLLYTSPSPRD